MTQLDKAKRLLTTGYSVITTKADKTPNIKWKEFQEKPPTKEQLENFSKIETTADYAICTGFFDVEVIDIDLKVFPILKQQNEFWNEYISFLKDNIDDFDDKFVIYKTRNNGYHILYRCSKIEGNQKLARNEKKEAIIETRGIGGYVIMYDKQISKLSYNEIQAITENDRDCLISCCKVFDNIPIEEQKPTYKKDDTFEFEEQNIKPWDDFINKNDVLDVVGDEFQQVANLHDRIVIRRLNANSSHSGYIFKNTGKLYLHSTGTQYPSEKILNSFDLYRIRYHNGDFKEAAKDVYSKGYGSRIIVKPNIIEKQIIINNNNNEFPIDIYPISIQNYLLECNKTLGGYIDFMGSGILWMLSLLIGNVFKSKIKNGWEESTTLWIALVAKAGVGKTPSIKHVVYPLDKINNKLVKEYIREYEKYEAYHQMDKKEKDQVDKIHKPRKKQLKVDDITMEALVELLEERKNAVGVLKDELAGWIKDMNKYREGSDKEFWLSSWSGGSITINRKTAKSAFVSNPVIPVLGGIQPGIFNNFYTVENKDSGFLDRILLSYPDISIENFATGEIEHNTLVWYNDYILNFHEFIESMKVLNQEDMEIIPQIVTFSDEAYKEYERIYNWMSELQNSDNENEYMKSMLSKMKNYVIRFSLILNTLYVFEDNNKNIYNISKESILNAEKLANYFINMAKKIKINSMDVMEMKTVLKLNFTRSKKEQAEAVFKSIPNFNKSELAELLSVTRKTLYNWIKEFEKHGK